MNVGVRLAGGALEGSGALAGRAGVESDDPAPSRGEPVTGVEQLAHLVPVGGVVDVGGTNMSGALAARDGAVKAKVRRSTDRRGGATAGLAMIRDIVVELAGHAARAGDTVERMGVGFGGPVDFERGVVLRSHHVEGWENVGLRDELQRAFHVPAVVDNDANAGTSRAI